MTSIDSPDEALAQSEVIQAIHRGIMSFTDSRVTYRLHHQRSYDWTDPEEWVRACSIAWLVIERDYPANRMKTEVSVPRRTPSDYADIVVYSDDTCRAPYLVVENKASGQSNRDRSQAVEQLFGNANSLRAPLGLYEEGSQSFFYDVANYPPQERESNRLGDRGIVPRQYGDVPVYAHIAGQPGDIEPVTASVLAKREKGIIHLNG